jgi:hypothetical protein
VRDSPPVRAETPSGSGRLRLKPGLSQDTPETVEFGARGCYFVGWKGARFPPFVKAFFEGLEMSASADFASEEFMKLGVQYYVAARYAAAYAALLPVSGNLYHHALEMFLKSGLYQKHPLQDLKKKFGHKLIDIWNAFKDDFPLPELPQFDATIDDIHDFEEIRYPEDVLLKKGAQMLVDWGSIPPQSNASEPMYILHVNNLDRLIADIFRASSRNPLSFTRALNQEAREILGRDNPVATQLLGN